MYSRIVKCITLAALALASMVTLQEIPQILLQFVVCGGALFVITEAVRSRKTSGRQLSWWLLSISIRLCPSYFRERGRSRSCFCLV